jgi:hypothetical protein
MGLYNFKQRFAPFILSGAKTHTIRAARRYPDKPGNTLHLYTGLRTKNTKLLMRVECVKVEEIRIWPIIRAMGTLRTLGVAIDDVELNDSECEQLARRDGFSSFNEFVNYWLAKGQPFSGFTGTVIHWRRKEKRNAA